MPQVNKRKMEMELKQLELAEARARALLLQPIDEESQIGDDDDDIDGAGGNIQLSAATTAVAEGDMIDFATISALLGKGAPALKTKEAAPWRAMLDDEDDIIEAPRSYSMPTFKKDALKQMPLKTELNKSQHK